MSSTSSKSTKSRRSSILKVRQNTVESTVDVVKQTKNHRRVSFHHEKTVKQYDKDKHELSATSPLKEAVKEAMSDFDSTKSNSTLMSIATPDRTTGDNHTMMLFRGMMSASGGEPISIHQETKDMSFSIMEDPSNESQNETLRMFGGGAGSSCHVKIHKETVDISYRMEESVQANPGDDTMDLFGRPSQNQTNRTLGNQTMDMEISQAETVAGGSADDTMAVFGTGRKAETTLSPLDNTMDLFGGGNTNRDRSIIDQSVMMDMSRDQTVVSSQDKTMNMFKTGSQSPPRSDESVAMEEATIIEEERKEEMTYQPSLSLYSQSIINERKESIDKSIGMKNQSILNLAKSPIDKSIIEVKSAESPGLEDTMAVFGKEVKEAGDDTMRMDISIAPSKEEEEREEGMSSPTMNLFKRKGEEEGEEMDITEIKRYKDDGREEGEKENEMPADKSVMDDTMGVFGMGKKDEGDQREASNVEVTAREETANATFTAHTAPGDSSQMDITEVAANGTFSVMKGGGDESKLDSSQAANATFDVLKKSGNKTADTSDMQNETFSVLKGCLSQAAVSPKNDTTFEVVKTVNASRMDVSSADETMGIFGKEEEIKDQEEKRVEREEKEEESEEMEESTSPQVVFETRKRLSTVIECSSRYTAASSQSMRGRVEEEGEGEGEKSTVKGKEGEEKEKEEGILDGIEGMEEEKEEEKSIRKEISIIALPLTSSFAHSPSPSLSNTTFSKRNMLDETRLSDRSILHQPRNKYMIDSHLESLPWMGWREEGIDGRIEEEGRKMGERMEMEWKRSESAVDRLLSQLLIEKGEKMADAVERMNPAKIPQMREFFDWARREAQREVWELRSVEAERLREMIEGEIEGRREEVKRMEEDVIMGNRLRNLKEEKTVLEEETRVGRGMEKEEIERVIENNREKEEEIGRLKREKERMEMESIQRSTQLLKIMAERSVAMDQEIKRKMEERERNKKEMRAYLSDITRHIN